MVFISLISLGLELPEMLKPRGARQCECGSRYQKNGTEPEGATHRRAHSEEITPDAEDLPGKNRMLS